MHDLRYANQILTGLKKKAGRGSKTRAIFIDVSLSPLSHVMPERLKETFSLLAEGEGYKNAILNVKTHMLSIRCRKCGKVWKSAKPTFECPSCNSADFELEKWEEFYIDSIRVGK